MIRTPYLLFLGAAPTRLDVKTATGVLHWRPEDCVGQWRTGAEAVDLGLPDLEPQAAHARGAHSLLLGAANEGGFLDPDDKIVALAAHLPEGEPGHPHVGDDLLGREAGGHVAGAG